MKLQNFRDTSKVQQYLKNVLGASQPNSTYDAVIIGGGMNVHFAAEDYIFYEYSCVALFAGTRGQAWRDHYKGQFNKVELAGSQILTIIITDKYLTS